MIVVLCTFLVLLAAPTLERESDSTPISPCPNVFKYELPRTEPLRWYGVINLSTDNTLHSLWINILFDDKVEILGNWFGHVTTHDNKNFKIENGKVPVGPGRSLKLRFFVQYKEKPPKLLAIRLNGRDICTPANIQRPIWIEQETQPVSSLNMAYTNIGNPLDLFVNKNLQKLKYPKSTNPEGTNGKPLCGKVDANTMVMNGKSKLGTQWPWQIALFKDEGMGNKYTCGGTLVTARHVITAAHCVTMKYIKDAVELYTLSVFLGKHNLWNSSDEVLIRFVKNIIVHPHYNASTYSRNVAILELHLPVKYTNWVKPACLWPKNDIDLKNIIGKKGLLLSWSFDDKNKVIDDLNQEEVPVVSQAMCIDSHERMVRFTSEYTYCAGNRREISSCASAGSGMVFKLGSTWYLRGLASLAIPGYNGKRCDTTHYLIFTDLAKFLPWINSIVFDF